MSVNPFSSPRDTLKTKFLDKTHQSQHLPYVDDLQMCPPWGALFACEACGTFNIRDIGDHRLRKCPEYSAFNRINNGIVRQFRAGLIPGNANGEPPVINGQEYRYIRDAYNLPGLVIMQQHILSNNPSWGPNDRVIFPQGEDSPALRSNTHTYMDLVMWLHQQLPRTFYTRPRPTSHSVAVRKHCTDPNNYNLNHMFHLEDENNDKVAVANFMDAHPQTQLDFQAHAPYNTPNWQLTNINVAKHGRPPALMVAGNLVQQAIVDIDLAPLGEGICGAGGDPRGVASIGLDHRQHMMNNPGNGNQYGSSLYTGKSANDVRNGRFTTPRRH